MLVKEWDGEVQVREWRRSQKSVYPHQLSLATLNGSNGLGFKSGFAFLRTFPNAALQVY